MILLFKLTQSTCSKCSSISYSPSTIYSAIRYAHISKAAASLLTPRCFSVWPDMSVGPKSSPREFLWLRSPIACR